MGVTGHASYCDCFECKPRSLDEAIKALAPIASMRRAGSAPLFRKSKGGLVAKTGAIMESIEIRDALGAAGVPFLVTTARGVLIYTVPAPTEWSRFTWIPDAKIWR